MKLRITKGSFDRASKGQTLNEYLSKLVKWKDDRDSMEIDLPRAGGAVVKAMAKYFRAIKTTSKEAELALPGDMLPRVWETLAAQFKVDLKPAAIKEAVVLWPKISGRDVKNFLRLASRIAARKGKAVDIALLKFVARFKT